MSPTPVMSSPRATLPTSFSYSLYLLLPPPPRGAGEEEVARSQFARQLALWDAQGEANAKDGKQKSSLNISADHTVWWLRSCGPFKLTRQRKVQYPTSCLLMLQEYLPHLPPHLSCSFLHQNPLEEKPLNRTITKYDKTFIDRNSAMFTKSAHYCRNILYMNT